MNDRKNVLQHVGRFRDALDQACPLLREPVQYRYHRDRITSLGRPLLKMRSEDLDIRGEPSRDPDCFAV